MKKQLASTEFQYRSNGKDYYKTCVTNADGSVVPGSRSLRSFTGSALTRNVKALQADVDRGCYKSLPVELKLYRITYAATDEFLTYWNGTSAAHAVALCASYYRIARKRLAAKVEK